MRYDSDLYLENIYSILSLKQELLSHLSYQKDLFLSIIKDLALHIHGIECSASLDTDGSIYIRFGAIDHVPTMINPNTLSHYHNHPRLMYYNGYHTISTIDLQNSFINNILEDYLYLTSINLMIHLCYIDLPPMIRLCTLSSKHQIDSIINICESISYNIFSNSIFNIVQHTNDQKFIETFKYPELNY